MPFLDLTEYPNRYEIDVSSALVKAELLRVPYSSVSPFPHCVIEEFLSKDILRAVSEQFPPKDKSVFFDRDQERFKFQFGYDLIDSVQIRKLLEELNSPRMLKILSSITGIQNLVPDPYLMGGGLHETLKGGHLSVHADFNLHPLLKLQRRLNLLVYLNDDWNDEFGGCLELWSKDMGRCEAKVLPVLGTAVLFNTDQDSFHGQPDPLTCPQDRSRRSIALYYYTVPEAIGSGIVARTTNFKKRPNSTDKTDWRVKTHHFVSDWVPPKLARLAQKLSAKLF